MRRRLSVWDVPVREHVADFARVTPDTRSFPEPGEESFEREAIDRLDEQARGDATRGYLNRLPWIEGKILELRFGLGGEAPMTLDAIAARLPRLTRDRARELEGSALRRLAAMRDEA
jgi:DNA-directed RNA polymerase sigma subunit (sigma70/sigma32)